MTALQWNDFEPPSSPSRALRVQSERQQLVSLTAASLLVALALLGAGLLRPRTVTWELPPEVPEFHPLQPVQPVLIAPHARPNEPITDSTPKIAEPHPVADPPAPPVETPGAWPSTPSLDPTPEQSASPREDPGCGLCSAPKNPETFQYVEVLPELVSIQRPVYPDLARDAGVEGTVYLWALIGPDGHAAEVRVQRSIPMLDVVAIAAARTATFKPARVNGRSVAAWVRLPIHFELH